MASNLFMRCVIQHVFISLKNSGTIYSSILKKRQRYVKLMLIQMVHQIFLHLLQIKHVRLAKQRVAFIYGIHT